jgi:CubicO group peptidase (beta-lactamase class C family)
MRARSSNPATETVCTKPGNSALGAIDVLIDASAEFVQAIAVKPPYFLPDTTPVISNAAFQLLAFALEAQSNGADFEKIISGSVFRPLQMNHSSLYSSPSTGDLFGNGINDTAVGEPAYVSPSPSTALLHVGNAQLMCAL